MQPIADAGITATATRFDGESLEQAGGFPCKHCGGIGRLAKHGTVMKPVASIGAGAL